ncbi:nucleosome assembly protein 1;2 [Tanacetum coccineum]
MNVHQNLKPAVMKRVEVLRDIQHIEATEYYSLNSSTDMSSLDFLSFGLHIEATEYYSSEHDELDAKFFDERAALEEKNQKLYAPLGTDLNVHQNLKPAVMKRVEVLRDIQHIEATEYYSLNSNTDMSSLDFLSFGLHIEATEYYSSEHDELDAKFFEERAALEAKNQKLYAPLYSKRYDIVTGAVEVDGAKEEDAIAKGVPGFWLTAMKNNKIMAEEITERDEVVSTTIEWLPGKCLTQKILKKKPKKVSKNPKPITKTEDCESFFNFFSPPEVPEDESSGSKKGGKTVVGGEAERPP